MRERYTLMISLRNQFVSSVTITIFPNLYKILAPFFCSMFLFHNVIVYMLEKGSSNFHGTKNKQKQWLAA